jgi:hypothetical protein
VDLLLSVLGTRLTRALPRRFQFIVPGFESIQTSAVLGSALAIAGQNLFPMAA